MLTMTEPKVIQSIIIIIISIYISSWSSIDPAACYSISQSALSITCYTVQTTAASVIY